MLRRAVTAGRRGLAGFLRRAGSIAEFDGGLPRVEGRGSRRSSVLRCQRGWIGIRERSTGGAMSRLRWARSTAYDPLLPLRRRTCRPRLAAFALLASLATRP